jgi:hypothetical protein
VYIEVKRKEKPRKRKSQVVDGLGKVSPIKPVISPK